MSPRWVTPAELIALGAIWGAAFLFMRVAAPELGALPLATMRLVVGGLVLLPFVIRDRNVLARDNWGRLVIVAALNSALPFFFFAWAARHSPAGAIAIANSTTSLFTAMVGFAAFGERIDRLRVIALLAGFAGVIVLVSGHTAGTNVIYGAIGGLSGALCYSISALLIKKHFSAYEPVPVAGATLLIGAALALPFGVPTFPDHPISTKAWINALLLGVVCTGFAYGLFFRLIRRVGAPRAVMVTYLVPLFAVIWAWLVLDEPVTVRMVVAAALILGSVALSQRTPSAAAAQKR